LLTYYLDNNNPTVQALNIGGTLTDNLHVTTTTARRNLVTVTIGGRQRRGGRVGSHVNLTETDAALSTGGKRLSDQRTSTTRRPLSPRPTRSGCTAFQPSPPTHLNLSCQFGAREFVAGQLYRQLARGRVQMA